jgi:hypothetical protein
MQRLFDTETRGDYEQWKSRATGANWAHQQNPGIIFFEGGTRSGSAAETLSLLGQEDPMRGSAHLVPTSAAAIFSLAKSRAIIEPRPPFRRSRTLKSGQPILRSPKV